METYKILAARKFNPEFTSNVLSLKINGEGNRIVIHKDVLTLIQTSNSLKRRKHKIQTSIGQSGNVLINFLDNLVKQEKIKRLVNYKFNTVVYCPC